MDTWPVVESIVSLTTSLRRQPVKYMQTTLLKTLFLFDWKNVRIVSFSSFSNKKYSVFVIFTFKILTKC